MNVAQSQAEVQSISYEAVPAGSKLDMVLSGLDPEYALSQLTARESDEVVHNGRQRRVLELRYGLEYGQTATLAEVAGILGVSSATVRQIEIKALDELAGIRDETRPEKVFDRPMILVLDNAYTYPPRKFQELQALIVEHKLAFPPHEYPGVTG